MTTALFRFFRSITSSIILFAIGLTCVAEDHSQYDVKANDRIEFDIDANDYAYEEFCRIMRDIYIQHPKCKIMAKRGDQLIDISHNGMWEMWPVVVMTGNETLKAGKTLCNIMEHKDATLVLYRVSSEGMPNAQMRSMLLDEIKKKKKRKLVYLFSASDDTPLSVLMTHIWDVTHGVTYNAIFFGKGSEQSQTSMK